MSTFRKLPSLAALLFIAVGFGCRGTVDPGAIDFRGVYRVSDNRAALSCAPQHLPPPLSSDTTQYVQFGGAGLPISSSVQVAQTSGTISLTPLDANGQAVPALALRGTIDGAKAITSRASTPRMEGPRDGGYVLNVTEIVRATTQFLGLVGTPVTPGQSGSIVGANLTTFVADSFVFRNDGAAGAVFTTCVVSDTVLASRIAN